jgi:hypothetical protein
MMDDEDILNTTNISLKTNDVVNLQHRTLCNLWAGCGQIIEVTVQNHPSIIIKRISMPKDCHSIGNSRKKASYICETNFYRHLAQHLNSIGCTVPIPLHLKSDSEGRNITIAMSKLEGSSGTPSWQHSSSFMRWLANLHSEYWGNDRADKAVALGIQEQGTYWYLETRPDELDAIPNHGWEGKLKQAASRIDMYLKRDDCFPTVVHGDAKLANILFQYVEEEEPSTSSNNNNNNNDNDNDNDNGDDNVLQCKPLVYDFQYCGKASCGKDLAKFLTCGTNAKDEEALLQLYHQELIGHLRKKWNMDDSELPSYERLAIVVDISICDLGRFMAGWGWWGIDRKQKIMKVLDQLDTLGI